MDVSGNLYAGGSFNWVDGVFANCVSKWNGSTWSTLGSGVNNTGVRSLMVDGSGNVYAGGTFTTAGTVTANRIAKWDGVSWIALGSGMNNAVRALAVDAQGNLYAGGDFTIAGGLTANAVAKWDGSTWSALSSGMPSGVVNALTVSVSGSVYAAGAFSNAGGVAAKCIAKWDGVSWNALGSGVNTTAYALVVDGSNLYVGGNLTAAGGKVSGFVAKAILDVPPTLTSPSSSSISVSTTTLGGNVTSAGNDSITNRGVVYSPTAINADPDLGETGVVQATTAGTTGVFTVSVTGLSPGTAYSFKAYSTNSAGTGYTSVATFTTLTAAQGAIAWATDNLLIGDNAQLTSTPFHDGVPNLLKYAFKLNGAGRDSHVMVPEGDSGLPRIEPQGEGAGRVFHFEFVRRIGSGLTYTPQLSRTLTSWADAVAPESATPIDSLWQRVVVDEPVGVDDTRVFGRVQVTAP